MHIHAWKGVSQADGAPAQVGELVRPWLAGRPEALKDTVPPQMLGDPDSQWVRVSDIDLHYKQARAAFSAAVSLSAHHNLHGCKLDSLYL